jgi:hypothetical protein
MKTFRRIVILVWVATGINLLLAILSPWYRSHIPYQVEGILIFIAVLLTGGHKIAKVYQAGMNRSTPP